MEGMRHLDEELERMSPQDVESPDAELELALEQLANEQLAASKAALQEAEKRNGALIELSKNAKIVPAGRLQELKSSLEAVKKAFDDARRFIRIRFKKVTPDEREKSFTDDYIKDWQEGVQRAEELQADLFKPRADFEARLKAAATVEEKIKVMKDELVHSGMDIMPANQHDPLDEEWEKRDFWHRIHLAAFNADYHNRALRRIPEIPPEDVVEEPAEPDELLN